MGRRLVQQHQLRAGPHPGEHPREREPPQLAGTQPPRIVDRDRPEPDQAERSPQLLVAEPRAVEAQLVDAVRSVTVGCCGQGGDPPRGER